VPGGLLISKIKFAVPQAVSALLLGACAISNAAVIDQTADLWSTHIRPILSQNCFKCHSELKQKGGLDLSTPATILSGGERGSAILPGKPEKSLLFQFIQPGADPHMPPKDHQLTEDEIAIIKRWISSLQTSSAQPAKGYDSKQWDDNESSLVRPNEPAQRPPANATASTAIDFYIRRVWKTAKVRTAPVCDDRTFVRRLYLDLVGRIPTPEDLSAFVNDSRNDKRAILVDRLLTSPEFAQNMAETFDVLLTGRRSSDEAWKQYLRYAFASNRPWDQIARDLIEARPASKEVQGAVYFLYSRNNNYQSMAEAVAPAFLGVQVNCAQCHNHPLAPEIKQRHYWGLVAFFNRSKNIQTSDGPALAEAATGGFVKFANLKKESQEAALTFVSNKTIPEKRPGDNEKEDDSAEKYLVPPASGKKVATVPKFSRREKLAELTTRDNPLLARTFVNRIWAMLLGRGFVHPADRMDSAHPPSHPDLLAWLAGDFERSHYDIRRLIRMICLSQAYQLDSIWRQGSKPRPELFAYGIEKPLRAEVLLRSILVATGRRAGSDGKLEGFEELGSVVTDRFPDVLAPESIANLRQALFLSNNAKFELLLKPKPGNTTAALLKLPGAREQVDAAFRQVLGRLPDRDEKKHGLQFLSSHLQDSEHGLDELIWALLTSAEFRFNH